MQYQTLKGPDIRFDEVDTGVYVRTNVPDNLAMTYFADQYSATANIFSLPCTLRAFLIYGGQICRVLEGHLSMSALTNSRRNLLSICLIASSRKPIAPVV